MRKAVSLGGGEYRLVTYDELDALLRESKSPTQTRLSLLRKYFPDEVAATHQRALMELNSVRWDRYQTESNDIGSKPHWLRHDDLLKRALLDSSSPKCDPSNGHHHTVSDFAEWIYSLYRPNRTRDALSRGKQGEKAILRRKKKVPSISPLSNWKPLYIDTLDGKPEALEISLLTVHGRSLYGAPDYVFKDDATQTILIVEVKVTDREIWSDTWPNLRAQLWAYAHIDQFMNQAKRIVLVGEVWAATGLSLRQIVSWQRSNAAFYTNNEQLFEAYQRWVEK